MRDACNRRALRRREGEYALGIPEASVFVRPPVNAGLGDMEWTHLYWYGVEPRLRPTLERMGGSPPQSWEMGFDGTGDFHMAALLEDRPARKAGKGWDQAA